MVMGFVEYSWDISDLLGVRFLDPADRRQLFIGQVRDEAGDASYCHGVLPVIGYRYFLKKPDQWADLPEFQEDLDPVTAYIKRERSCPAGLGLDRMDIACTVIPEIAGAVCPYPDMPVSVPFEGIVRYTFGKHPVISIF
jgi:hypothetical protein